MKKTKPFYFTQLYGIDNVLSIQTDKKKLYMLKTNGMVYQYDGKQIIHFNPGDIYKQIAFVGDYAYCTGGDEKYISCYQTLLIINKHNVRVKIEDYSLPFEPIDGYVTPRGELMVIDSHHRLYYVCKTDPKFLDVTPIDNLITPLMDNVIKVATLSPTIYYVIV